MYTGYTYGYVLWRLVQQVVPATLGVVLCLCCVGALTRLLWRGRRRAVPGRLCVTRT